MDEQERSQPWHQSPVRGDHMERRLGMENMSRRQEDLPLSSQKQRRENGGMSLF